MAEINGVARGWDDEFDASESKQQNYVTLNEGDYDFEITKFERGRFPGSAKIPECNRADVTIKITTSAGVAMWTERLILWSTLDWKVASFARCIGIDQKDGKVKVNWNQIVGKRGRAHVTRDHGQSKDFNNVKRWLPVADWAKTEASDDAPAWSDDF